MFPVYNKILVFENVEDDFYSTAGLPFIVFYGLYGDLRRLSLRKAENPGGDATESNAFTIIFICEFQARGIAGSEQFTMPIRQFAVHDRTDRMEHIFARQIERRCDLRLPGRFLMTLLLHNVVAEIAQTKPRRAVYAVILAVVERSKAAEHLRICGVDDSITFQRCDVALP